MATSEIRLYRTEITPERNAVIDDIKDFLKEKCTLTYEEYKFQYQKIDVNKTITIAADQNRIGNQSLGNYCDIYQDKRHFYYFITSAEWISQNAVRLTISMDTLNTFRDKLEFTDQTTIQREHRDRFKNLDADDFGEPATDIGKKNTLRLIDKQREDLPTVEVLSESNNITDKVTPTLDWYLIYRTRDNLTPDNIANPIDCNLITNEPLLIKKGFTNLPAQKIVHTFLDPGLWYYMDPVNNPGAKMTIHRELGPASEDYNLETDGSCIWRFRAVDDKIGFSRLLYDKNGAYWDYRGEAGVGACYSIDFKQSVLLKSCEAPIRSYSDIINRPTEKPLETGTKEDLKTIAYKELDKTDSKLMKIIRLPYSPANVTKNSDGSYVFPKEWEFKNGVMRLNTYNLATEFYNNLGDVSLDKYLKLTPYVSPKSYISSTNESKLYNSEFFTYKFVYDSFAKDIRFEDINIDTTGLEPTDPITVNIGFKPTNTVNSTMAFKFDINDLNYKYATKSDYEPYLLVKRNNEETIFSNDYINYIRNGYNYDQKARERGLTQNIIGTVASGLAGVAHLGIPFGIGAYRGWKAPYDSYDASHPNWSPEKIHRHQAISGGLEELGGSSIAAVAGVSAFTNTISGVVNTVASYQSATDAINQKLQTLGNQATDVKGADDVDLLKFYSDNKLSNKVYTLQDNNKNAIVDLFHFTGYSHPFRERPDISSRYWFNFVQCTPVFKNENTSVYTEYLDDIKLRFEKGVTYYHHHPEIDLGWDIYQENENWETSLLDTKYLPDTKITTVGITNSIIGEGIGRIKYVKFDIDQDYPLDTTYQAIQVKYTNLVGKEMKAIKDPRNPNQYKMPSWDSNTPIYARRANIMNEPLSSEWEIVYSSEATVITSSSTFADLTIKGALVNDQLGNYSYILLRGTPNELKLESDPSGETDRILPVIYQENDIYDLYVFRSNIDLNGELYGKWESWHIFEGDEEEPGWHGGRVILTQPIIIG